MDKLIHFKPARGPPKSMGFSAALAFGVASAYVEVRDENRCRRLKLITDRIDVNTIEVGHIDRPSQTLDLESVGLSLADGKQLLYKLKQAVIFTQADEICGLRWICRPCRNATRELSALLAKLAAQRSYRREVEIINGFSVSTLIL